ncbi:MAG TPA: SPOR domain-containing protein [Enterovirga sp.]
MADRYQDRPFSADDDYDRGGDPHAPAKGESDPLAELARLIGQTDPFASRANQQVQPHAERDQYELPVDEPAAPSPPPWMQRANRQEAPQQDYPSAVHPLLRHATPQAAPEPDYYPAPPLDDAGHEPDPSRYDDALYGQLEAEAQHAQHDPAYSDDPYAYQDGYGDGIEDQPRKRGGGMMTVVVVLALAVVGTGAAFAYRTYVGSPRSGEPPIIKAEAGPNKIVPAPADGGSKVQSRMTPGDGSVKMGPPEEEPVDVNNVRSGPRVVFPPLNQNNNPPSNAGTGPAAQPLTNAVNGTLPSSEPRKIKTFSVRGEQPDGAATPVGSAGQPPAAKPAAARSAATAPPPPPAAAATRSQPSAAANANASSANSPLSLSPQGAPPAPVAEPRTRVATTNPVQTAPQATSGGGGYLVQVASQKNEADAQASYRALQGKYPAVLGSRSPVIKRADLGDKGIYYRAMVGPFGSPDEASQFCGSLKTAGGQCVVQRN